ncbi:MAG: hypothetical protein GX490_10345 [Bacilli bacterium]|nr:hypothetical protein [Bacilli bacterium]
MKRLVFFVSFVFILVVVPSLTVKAEAPYVTRTINRFGEWVETQEAYEPVAVIKSFGDGDTFNKPKDLFITDDDTIFVADTGNKRIVVLNNNYELITTFGEDRLTTPTGVYVRDDYIYIADFGKEDDLTTGRVFIYQYDKELGEVSFYKELGRPESRILEVDQFIYRPEKIAVDKNHTMYIVSQGSYNGILLVNSENRFLNYFAPNSVKGTLWDRIQYLLYADNPRVILTKKIPPPPYNVSLDDRGFIYTVTQTVIRNNVGDTVKKVNIGGVNFFPVEMIASDKFVDSIPGHVGNLYVATQSGFIYEYDYDGNVLFIFAGNGYGYDKIGLFSSISGIAVDSQGNLLVLDDNRNNLQIFKETLFAKTVHEALALYNEGRYIESQSIWEEVLRYNSMYDLAHKGIGLAKYMKHDYKEALEKFKIANAKEQYSDAFWEIRNEWLLKNAGILMISIFGLFVALKTIQFTNRRYAYLTPVKTNIKKLKNVKTIDELLFSFRYIKNPADTCYEVKFHRRISVKTSLLMLVILFGIYILSILYTGFLFNNFILERTVLFKEALKIVFPIIAFVIANHLISSLMEGEGTFRAIFINTIGALLPVYIILPFLIIISNFITYNEAFLYHFGMFVMLSWSAVMLFANVKETHNFTIKQTIINLILTVLMMIIIILVAIMVYIMVIQVVEFVVDIVKEVMLRG